MMLRLSILPRHTHRLLQCLYCSSASIAWTDQNLFDHFPSNAHSGCFQSFTITNKAAANILYLHLVSVQGSLRLDSPRGMDPRVRGTCIYDCEGSRVGIFRVCWCSTTTCVPVCSDIRRAVLCGEHGAPTQVPILSRLLGLLPPLQRIPTAPLPPSPGPQPRPAILLNVLSPSISSLASFLEPPPYSLSADDLTACLTEAVEATRGERPQSPTATPNCLPASVPESPASFLGPRQPPYSAQPGL